MEYTLRDGVGPSDSTMPLLILTKDPGDLIEIGGLGERQLQ